MVWVGQSHITVIKMAQHLDSRCVLLSDPSTLGAGGPNQTRLESSIKKFNPHLMYYCIPGQTTKKASSVASSQKSTQKSTTQTQNSASGSSVASAAAVKVTTVKATTGTTAPCPLGSSTQTTGVRQLR